MDFHYSSCSILLPRLFEQLLPLLLMLASQDAARTLAMLNCLGFRPSYLKVIVHMYPSHLHLSCMETWQYFIRRIAEAWLDAGAFSHFHIVTSLTDAHND